MVDAADDAGGQQHLLAEDPRAGVDHDVVQVDLVACLVDLPDMTVDRFDPITDEVAAHVRAVAERPDLYDGHDALLPFCVSNLPRLLPANREAKQLIVHQSR